MKFPLFTLGVISAAAFFGSAAKAQNYPWCARINFGDEAVSCSFESFEQCMASLSGGGASGYCIKNNTYQAPAPESPQSESNTAADATPAQTVPIPRKKPN